MARLSRFVVPGFAHHVIHRAVTGGRLFADDADLESLLTALRRSSVEQGVQLHAYACVPSELQLLVTPMRADDLSRMMQALARFYVPAYNRRHGRSGALWQGRFRAAPVGGAEELLDCMLYVEQLPVRAGEAAVADEFAGSSAAQHAGLRADAGLVGVPSESAFWALGNTPFERDVAYRRRLAEPLPADAVARIEQSTLKGWALGPGEFLAGLRGMTARRLGPGARGRPKGSMAV